MQLANYISFKKKKKKKQKLLYITIHKFDRIWLPKSYLDSSLCSDNNNLYGIKHRLVRAAHSGNDKGGCAFVYFKEYLSVWCLPNLYLKEYLTVEVSINNKRVYFSMTDHQIKFPMFLTQLPLV